MVQSITTTKVKSPDDRMCQGLFHIKKTIFRIIAIDFRTNLIQTDKQFKRI